MLTEKQSEWLEIAAFCLMALVIVWLIYSDTVLIENLQADIANLRQENAAIQQLLKETDARINLIDYKTKPDAIQKAMFNWLEGK